MSDSDDYGWDEESKPKRRRKNEDWSEPDRKTKRPQNLCGACSYTGFPRGKGVSLKCPKCGSKLVQSGCAGALLLMIVASASLVACLILRAH